MKRIDLSYRQFTFILATRVALGAGLALLAAPRLGSRRRQRLGRALFTLGVVTTAPALYVVFRKNGPPAGAGSGLKS